MLSASPAAAAAFRWCSPLDSIPRDQLLSARPPSYPADYLMKAHVQEDGSWVIDASVERVWQAFLAVPMQKAWKSKIIQFGFSTGEDPGLAVGNRYYMDIYNDPFGYFCNMGFGVQITEVVPGAMVKYEYLDFSPAWGEQWLTIESLGPKQTRLRLQTRYLGKDFAIDSAYPLYHKEAIGSFMRSLKKLIEEREEGL